MEKAITTALLLIASVVAAVALINAVYPSVSRGSGALVESSGRAAERVRTDIDIVFATGDTSTNEVVFWVKNVGVESIFKIDESDLFLTTPSGVKRIPYSSGTEHWTFSFEGDAQKWTRAVTIKIVVTLTSLPEGLYDIQFTVPNGVMAKKEFSI
ncbi:MAG: hypothetical protein HY672_01745 [Chloroflexi bacterium]|nr:hypothetical protein [Chloroflexota bacterium]